MKSFMRCYARLFSGVSGGRFVTLYESLVSEGKIRLDPRQRAVVGLMQTLGEQLESGIAPIQTGKEPGNGKSWFDFGMWKNSKTSIMSPPALRGLYIFGGCGTGKTMLMDLFFENLKFSPKKRVHFHEYMIDVHSRLFAIQKQGATQKKTDGDSGDLVDKVATELMQEARLLCFDEFQVTHISDAVLMRRLFSIMLSRGTIVVATSNRRPDDLYRNGLNRELFIPFIPVLKEYCVVHNMDSETDYRQMSNSSGDLWRTWFSPLSVDSSKALESKFFRLANNDIELDTPSLEVQGRCVAIRRAARKSDIAWFTFNELCDKPLGSADYITLAKRFHTVFLEAIPQLTLQELNQARRLITLIDALYDHGTRIFFSCQANIIGEIFQVDAVTRQFSSLDEVFAWDRTVSRLTEMTSVEYQIKHARKLSAKQFFGQYDLLGDSINENELREIFARYDKNNDGIIALAGLNRMINDINLYISEGSSPDDALIAAPQLIQSFTGSTEGKRIHFDRFKRVVGEKGLLSMIP